MAYIFADAPVDAVNAVARVETEERMGKRGEKRTDTKRVMDVIELRYSASRIIRVMQLYASVALFIRQSTHHWRLICKATRSVTYSTLPLRHWSCCCSAGVCAVLSG